VGHAGVLAVVLVKSWHCPQSNLQQLQSLAAAAAASSAKPPGRGGGHVAGTPRFAQDLFSAVVP
jgi:hypothetical protein